MPQVSWDGVRAMKSPLEQSPIETYTPKLSRGDRVQVLYGSQKGLIAIIVNRPGRGTYQLENCDIKFRAAALKLLPPIEQSPMEQTPRKTTRNRTIARPRVVVTVPIEPVCNLEPGDRISTRAGTATVTEVEQVGRAQVVHADYGSGISQPHRVEDLEVGSKVQATLQLFGEPCLVQGVIIEAPDSPIATAVMQYSHEVAGELVEGEVQLPRFKYSPIEQIEQDADDAIATIEQRITAIQNAGEIAADGCWLEVSKCFKRVGTQVFYRASQPIFNGKRTRYVGMKESVKHAAATEAIGRRDELKSLRKQLEILKGGTYASNS